MLAGVPTAVAGVNFVYGLCYNVPRREIAPTEA
jgi:hypothetical protein